MTCSPLRGPAYYAPYLRAVAAAGGEPVMLDPAPDGLAPETATALVHTIDGLLVPGGWDVDPPAYGEARDEETPEVDPPLDLTEIALVPVVAVDHPLASAPEPITREMLEPHVQLVLTDRTPLAAMWAMARGGRIYDGPDEVHRMVVSRRILKEFAAGRPYRFS